MEKRTCARCGYSIKRKNKSGYCQPCGVIVRESRRVCKGCGVVVSTKSCGYCRPCSNKFLAHNPRKHARCACGKTLKVINRSGKCLACYRARFLGKQPPAPPPASRIWCVQCERNVLIAEASQCRSQWCGARAVA